MLSYTYHPDKVTDDKHLEGKARCRKPAHTVGPQWLGLWWKMMPLLFLLPCHPVFGQQKEAAEKLVMEGVEYHDKGDYEGAIRKYDQALQLDKDNMYALAEKAMSLLMLKKYQEAIDCCERVFGLYQGHKALEGVYITCGTAYDGLLNPGKALATYDAGIRLFPSSHMLYFNKGITLISLNNTVEAAHCFEQSAARNPSHASSHNAIARICLGQKTKIPSLMALGRFLVLEPQGVRATQNLELLRLLMNANTEETGTNKVSIEITEGLLAKNNPDGTPVENNFAMTELMLGIMAAIDHDKKFKKETEAERLVRKFETICTSLSEAQGEGVGFYWDYYVPYYLEMKEKGLIETFVHIILLPSGQSDVKKWIKSHEKEIEEFYDWSSAFQWPASFE